MPFLIVRNDITQIEADAIVNPANQNLLEGSGTSRAIFRAAGEEEMAKACREIGGCGLGKAVATSAFRLRAQYVIHAVGPVWQGGGFGEEQILYSAYAEALKLAEAYRLESIAFPLLSSGNYGYPKEEAFKTAIRAIGDFLMEHDMLVYLVLYDRNALCVSKKLFDSVKEYIDDHYVEENDEGYRPDKGGPMRGIPIEVPQFHPAAPRSPAKPSQSFAAAPKMPARNCETVFMAPKRNLDQLMEHMDETFSQMLLRLIDERGLKDSYVYKKANIDRRLFSKIRNDIDYVPSKKTVLAFAVALELSLDETKDLLMRAGFAFSCCSKFDVIISYFIENRRYNMFEVNEMLFAYGQPLLGE